MRETWYVMEDGAACDPNRIRAGDDGRLVADDGRLVAYGPHGPLSRSIIPSEEAGGYKTAEMKPERPARGYKTRKAD
jgi:hypothetical protein